MAQELAISIHALLAESDDRNICFYVGDCNISIHALLAESDLLFLVLISFMLNFYPRSPCGERLRPNLREHYQDRISIHALLAESDRYQPRSIGQNRYFYPRSPCGERPPGLISLFRGCYFYPRSPCGERRGSGVGSWPRVIFLSTLSLRRATSDGKRTSILY